ncbi:hypothetical protein HYPSUDRAFT_50857 [Hypholoma sublateritium FD-334 SS-4]|uniref:rRNA biogenesis protein RRP36 n=1 Tax=Hypholoma sublateritium (strain FD-334 SS-4) TaxID=945553 RepID=A0A0D2QCW4_HYPSF|nr:hypothetical protein HYPSUDRAFT_50857 [Hypholoma sublateritium FD-334 SS-4]
MSAKANPTAGSKRRLVEAEPSESSEESDSGVELRDEEEFEEGSSQGSGSAREFEEDGEEDDVDVDAPRVAQWEEDDEGFLEESEAENDGPEEQTLKNDLQDLPLGALRQAQRILGQAEAESDSESDSDGESGGSADEPPTVLDTKGKGKEKVEKVEWSIKRRDDIAKRSSKHAPTEVTSKRPVTRKRQVIEVPKLIPRDPRFLPMTGEFSADKFQQSYSFLAENHKKELSTLREALKQARKLLSSSPRDLRSAREHEVYRLEQAIKRAESLVNKDRLDQVQRDALGKIKKEEATKRTQGKGEWHLKRGEVQKVVVQARYEALAKEGGQRAVKRAIEKKQKKESQKEKRSRPYAKGEYSAKDSDRPVKRRRV